MINLYFILLAGGIGSRAKTKLPKQFVKIQEKTLGEYSLETILSWYKSLKKNKKIQYGKIVFVSHPLYIKKAKKIYKDYNLIFTEGGDSRHDSTKKGMLLIKEDSKEKQKRIQDSLIFIHDIARPIFFINDLENMLNVFLKESEIDCISLVTKTTETVIEKYQEKIKTLDREKIFSVKTPQALRGKYLELFLTRPTKNDYTDLITWALEQNLNIKLVDTIPYNLKVTYPIDFKLIEFLLLHRKQLQSFPLK
ncbi:MAG: 2-C-methyl-D-erythritol 4-phosphate cytidylyltransferase [Leptonema sp. (in: bacteria)]